jgi:hypothetical protein
MVDIKWRKLFYLFVVSSLLSACNFSADVVDEDPSGDAISTASHQTVIAKLTEIAAQFTQTPLSTTAITSVTPMVLPATETPTPTPTTTSIPTSTPTPEPCDLAAFVADITIQDGATLSPGNEFTKTWRLKNAGVCTWTKDYALVFIDGDQMKAPSVSKLSGSVKPGQTVDLSVKMVAPEKSGPYKGYWMLRNTSGKLFGLGPWGEDVFWVDIKVQRVETRIAYKFVSHYCEAEWRSEAGVLPCPGEEGDPEGFILKLDAPRVEGRSEDEPALYTRPERVEDGWISGRFPGIDIKDGDRFEAVIGCLYEAESCNVKFQLEYEGGDGFVHTLERWHEVYDGEIWPIHVDLSELAGENVRFIFRVDTNGSPEEDRAFWLNPRVLRIED